MVSESAGAVMRTTMVVFACDAIGHDSGGNHIAYPARTLNVSVCSVTAVPALAMVVLLTSAVKPAAVSLLDNGCGVGALPPLPDVV